MRFLALLTALASSAASAFAACPAGQTPVFRCTFKAGQKFVDVCQSDSRVTYAYGKTGQSPELQLSVLLRDLKYTPWNGIGRAIYEQIVFRNKDVSYVVWSAFERNPELANPLSAGIVVEDQNEKVLAELQCDQGSIDSGIDGLYQAMEDQNMCWSFEAFEWQGCK